MGQDILKHQLDAATGCARSYWAKMLDRFPGGSQDGVPVDIIIFNGLHAGCRTSIAKPGFLVGSDEKADIMLLDPDMDGSLVELRTVQTMFGPAATLITDRKDVKLNGVGNERGAPYAKLPCILSIGSVDVEVRPELASAPPVHRKGELAAIAGLAAIGIITLAASFLIPAQRQTVFAMNPAPAAQPEPVQTSYLSDMVQNHISEAKMGRYMRANIGVDDTVVISGTVPKAKMPAWRDLRDMIDSSPEADRVIAKVREATVLKDVPAIKMVRLTPVPSVFLANGKMLTISDELISQWRIVAITESGIIVAQDGEEVTIKY